MHIAMVARRYSRDMSDRLSRSTDHEATILVSRRATAFMRASSPGHCSRPLAPRYRHQRRQPPARNRGDEPELSGVARCREHNRNRCSRGLGSKRRSGISDNHGDVLTGAWVPSTARYMRGTSLRSCHSRPPSAPLLPERKAGLCVSTVSTVCCRTGHLQGWVRTKSTVAVANGTGRT
jgi:hypothetical protein